jgi:hypothetical protein
MGLFDKGAARPAPAAPSAKVGGYDFVEFPTSDGSVQRMTRSQFEAQPLEARVRVLVQGTARFFRGGQVVPSAQALRRDD